MKNYNEPEYVSRLKEHSKLIKKYFYKYYQCADFLNIFEDNIYEQDFAFFKDINRDVMLNQRLLDQIVANPQTKAKRMQIYQNYFYEKLARLNNNDGTFCFVLPSGKVISDKFVAFGSEEEMCPEVSRFETVDLKEEVLGTGRAKLVKNDYVAVVNFVNKFGIYLLDQSKIRTRKDVLAIIAIHPAYLKQIPATFFKDKNISAIKNEIEMYYKINYTNLRQVYFMEPYIKSKLFAVDDLIAEKVKLLEKIENSKLQKEQEEEYVYPSYKQQIQREKTKYSEAFKRQSFPTLYKYFDLLDKKYAKLMRGKNNFEKMQLRSELLEKKTEIVEKYRESLCTKRRYVPTNADPFNRFLDDDQKWKELEEQNSRIEEKIKLLDMAVVQSINDKLYIHQDKVAQNMALEGDVVAKTIRSFLQQKYPETFWKIDTVYVPDMQNIKPIERMGKWIDVEHESLKYIAVVNSSYPKSLKIESVSEYETAEKIMKRIERQIKNGNIVFVCQENKPECDLSKNIAEVEYNNQTHLPTASIEPNGAYGHFEGIEDVLLEKIVQKITPKRKTKKLQAEDTQNM